MKKREGYTIKDGRYAKEIKRDIKAKVLKPWPHLGEKTKVGKEVSLSSGEYFFVLEKGLIEASPDQPRLLEE